MFKAPQVYKPFGELLYLSIQTILPHVRSDSINHHANTIKTRSHITMLMEKFKLDFIYYFLIMQNISERRIKPRFVYLREVVLSEIDLKTTYDRRHLCRQPILQSKHNAALSEMGRGMKCIQIDDPQRIAKGIHQPVLDMLY